MATSTRTVTVTKTGESYGGPDYFGGAPQVNGLAPDDITTLVFTAATFATVAVPTHAQGCEMQIPAGYNGTITLKGVTGDVGTPLPTSGEVSLPLTGVWGLLFSANATVNLFWY